MTIKYNSLDLWKKMFGEVYGPKNEELDQIGLIDRTDTEITDVQNALFKKSLDETRKQLADVFSFVCSLAEKYNVSLDESATKVQSEVDSEKHVSLEALQNCIKKSDQTQIMKGEEQLVSQLRHSVQALKGSNEGEDVASKFGHILSDIVLIAIQKEFSLEETVGANDMYHACCKICHGRPCCCGTFCGFAFGNIRQLVGLSTRDVFLQMRKAIPPEVVYSRSLEWLDAAPVDTNVPREVDQNVTGTYACDFFNGQTDQGVPLTDLLQKQMHRAKKTKAGFVAISCDYNKQMKSFVLEPVRDLGLHLNRWFFVLFHKSVTQNWLKNCAELISDLERHDCHTIEYDEDLLVEVKSNYKKLIGGKRVEPLSSPSRPSRGLF